MDVAVASRPPGRLGSVKGAHTQARLDSSKKAATTTAMVLAEEEYFLNITHLQTFHGNLTGWAIVSEIGQEVNWAGEAGKQPVDVYAPFGYNSVTPAADDGTLSDPYVRLSPQRHEAGRDD
jgi:alpha-glucuronidase